MENTPAAHGGLEALDSTNELNELELNTRRWDYFATDQTDEFQVTREDGTVQGIFKVFSPPVIPLYETNGANVQDAITEWSEDLRGKPLAIYQSLEYWRGQTETSDRRLQTIYDSRPLPSEAEDRFVEYFNRMKLAFSYAAPFYNIEALVADSRDNRSDNPIDFAQESRGGHLDAVAMLLPSALQDQITARTTDWNGLSWEELQTRTKSMRDSLESQSDDMQARQFKIIGKIAKMADVSPEDILFVANALQFIPTEVAGKATDMPQEESLEILENVLATNDGAPSSELVAKNINALIRFRNWTPAIRSNANFSGKHWAYDAVCDSAAKIMDILADNPEVVFGDEFASTYNESLASQLQDLDATSAKGRFFLQLFNEGRFKPEIADKITQTTGQFSTEVIFEMRNLQQSESLIDITRNAPVHMVGGKATGLRRAINIFGEHRVHPGKAITSEATNAWLYENDGIANLIDSLRKASDTEDKVKIGEEIQRLIYASEVPTSITENIKLFFPDKKIVLRSSSFDEDTDVVGPAPGIYESVLNVSSSDNSEIELGLKEVLSSFFSDKAISFRELKGLRHNPNFAILVQEFNPSTGGTIFINNGEVVINIGSDAASINDLENASSLEEKRFMVDDIESVRSDKLTDAQLSQIATISRMAEAAHGPSDMEFVINEAGDVCLLQLRSLEHSSDLTQSGEDYQGIPTSFTVINSVDSLPELLEDAPSAIKLNPEIDLEKFQGSFFRWIVANRLKISTILVEQTIPPTCHFANIVATLGIRLESLSE